MSRGRAALGLLGLGVIGMSLACAASPPPRDEAPMEQDGRYAKDDAPRGYAADAEAGVAPAAPAAVAPMKSAAADSAPAAKKEKAKGETKPHDDANADKAPDDDSGGGERMRSWFPEAFLWRPLVVTDAAGTARIDVRVPDQLTTWRILALAHTQHGEQAGAIKTFASALPLYVDPVVPGWMYAGDRIDLPIQVVNTTDATVTAPLTVKADGALSGQAAASLSLPGGATVVQRVTLLAEGAGKSHVTAILSGGDAVQREIPVNPRGRPVDRVRGGTVSSTVGFGLDAPEGADPTTEELQVLVFPGPLAVLQGEIDRGGSSATACDAAYGFALATRIGDLSKLAGFAVDPETVRRLRIVSWQRVVQYARAPDAGAAADLLAAMHGTTDHEQAVELIRRLQRTLADGQRADGTWARNYNGTLQNVLVNTAYSGRQLSDDQTGPRLKAKGALTRQIAQIQDPYTAAVALASGLVGDADAEKLRAIVTDALVDVDGHKSVAVPGQVTNPWGWAPTRAEMLAWTILALPPTVDYRGDLVAELMSGYDANWGFGAGQADVVALEAVATSLPGIDKPVDVVLKVDGVEVDRARLDPSQPKLPAVLDARGAVGQIDLAVSPPVPGLAYVATLHAWVPWTGAERLPGVDVEVAATPMRVAEDATISLTLAAPSGTSLVIEQGLPAGATVDEGALSAMSDRVVDFSVKTDRVRLVTRPFQAGEAMILPIVVRPTFAGAFSTIPLAIEPRGDDARRVEVAPLVWTVSG